MRTETKIIEIYSYSDLDMNPELKAKVLNNLSNIKRQVLILLLMFPFTYVQ